MVAHTTRARVAKPVSIPDPASIFTVLKITNEEGGDEAPVPRVSVRGVYVTEEQAYAAAIHNLIFELEQAEGSALPKLRAIAKTKTASLKDRLASLLSCQDDPDSDRLDFVVKKTELFPHEELDMDAVLDATVMPYTYWGSSDDEQDYDPAEDDEDADGDDDEDEDGMDLEAEMEGGAEGVEGSGTKVEEEEGVH